MVPFEFKTLVSNYLWFQTLVAVIFKYFLKIKNTFYVYNLGIIFNAVPSAGTIIICIHS